MQECVDIGYPTYLQNELKKLNDELTDRRRRVDELEQCLQTFRRQLEAEENKTKQSQVYKKHCFKFKKFKVLHSLKL